MQAVTSCRPRPVRDGRLAGRGARLGGPFGQALPARLRTYWLEPWIEDLFRDIKQKKMTVKKAAMMTGTTYGQVYRQYK